MDTVKIITEEGVLEMRNGSCELFFDDEGILQQIVFKKKRRKREGENLKLFDIKNGSSLANYDKNGILQLITYETQWRRNRQEKE